MMRVDSMDELVAVLDGMEPGYQADLDHGVLALFPRPPCWRDDDYLPHRLARMQFRLGKEFRVSERWHPRMVVVERL